MIVHLFYEAMVDIFKKLKNRCQLLGDACCWVLMEPSSVQKRGILSPPTGQYMVAYTLR